MNIVTSRTIYINEGIFKVTVTQKSRNLGVEGKFLDGLKHGAKTTRVSSFSASAWRNQFGTANITKILHITLITTISDVSMSFQNTLWSDQTIDAVGQ